MLSEKEKKEKKAKAKSKTTDDKDCEKTEESSEEQTSDKGSQKSEPPPPPNTRGPSAAAKGAAASSERRTSPEPSAAAKSKPAKEKWTPEASASEAEEGKTMPDKQEPDRTYVWPVDKRFEDRGGKPRVIIYAVGHGVEYTSPVVSWHFILLFLFFKMKNNLNLKVLINRNNYIVLLLIELNVVTTEEVTTTFANGQYSQKLEEIKVKGIGQLVKYLSSVLVWILA